MSGDLVTIKDRIHKEANAHYVRSKFQNVAVQFSSAIAAYGRVHLVNAINSVCTENLYYSDTDSIFINKGSLNNFYISNYLGDFKLVDKVDEAFFLSPKNYCYTSHLTKKAVMTFPSIPSKTKASLSKEFFTRHLARKDHLSTIRYRDPFRKDTYSLRLQEKVLTHKTKIFSKKRRKVFRRGL